MTHLAQERRASGNLERQNWEHYLPEILAPRRSGGTRSEILFPGYIFVRVEVGRDWSSLASTRGISRLLTAGDCLIRMPDEEIRVLKSSEVDGHVALRPRFRQGERIEVTHEDSGLLGLAGIYDGQESVGRCRVLLSVLGRMVPHVMLEGELSSLAA